MAKKKFNKAKALDDVKRQMKKPSNAKTEQPTKSNKKGVTKSKDIQRQSKSRKKRSEINKRMIKAVPFLDGLKGSNLDAAVADLIERGARALSDEDFNKLASDFCNTGFKAAPNNKLTFEEVWKAFVQFAFDIEHAWGVMIDQTMWKIYFHWYVAGFMSPKIGRKIAHNDGITTSRTLGKIQFPRLVRYDTSGPDKKSLRRNGWKAFKRVAKSGYFEKDNSGKESKPQKLLPVNVEIDLRRPPTKEEIKAYAKFNEEFIELHELAKANSALPKRTFCPEIEDMLLEYGSSGLCRTHIHIDQTKDRTWSPWKREPEEIMIAGVELDHGRLNKFIEKNSG